MKATYELLADLSQRLPKLLGASPRVEVSFSGYMGVLTIRVFWLAGLYKHAFERAYTGVEVSLAVSSDMLVDAFVDECKRHCEAVERHADV